MLLPPSDRLCLRLFGTFEATRDGLPLPGLHLREGERLLAFLTLRADEPIPARELALKFWPAETQGNLVGQNEFPSLRQALFMLRKALGPDAHRLTRPERTNVQFDLAGADVDIRAFDRLARTEPDVNTQSEELQGADAWEAAVALYRGPVLQDWNEAWAADARLRRQRTLERILRRLAQDAQANNHDAGAEQWLRRLLSLRPDDEAATRDLLRLLHSRRQYAEMNEAREALQEVAQAAGRGLEPETLSLVAALRAHREQQNSPQPPAPSPKKAWEKGSQLLVTAAAQALVLEPAGGAVPLGSPFYVERAADAEFAQAVARRDSIVLVKGARQVGKTSLLAHGLQGARQAGTRVVITDFQDFNEAQFATPDALLFALATTLAVQLDLETLPRETWDADCGPNMNLALYLRRHALRAVSGSLVWALDEVDRLFGCPFGSEVFSLFRSWHNARALDPESPWTRLTLAIAYSTEASLFITDLNQSPFNVGTRLSLQDFTLEQTALLNQRYGNPLSPEETLRFYNLIEGQPYLARRGLDELAVGRMNFARLEAESAQDDGPFGEHLRRLPVVLSRSPDMLEVVRALLIGQPCESPNAFFRLRAAGVLSGGSCQEARLRCRLYAVYLARALA